MRPCLAYCARTASWRSVQTNPFNTQEPQYYPGITVPVPHTSNDTAILAKAADWGLKRIYKPGFRYKKAGIMLMELTTPQNLQGDLFATPPPQQDERRRRLMEVLDRVNATFGRGTLRLASEGHDPQWAMRRDKVTPGYTTQWETLPVAY